MLYISHCGTYLIDRRMKVSRVHMRFPLWSRPDTSMSGPASMAAWFKLFDAGMLRKALMIDPKRMELHHGTLLDGEMVVNGHPDGRQDRVFYAYDLMMLQGVNVTARPWKVCSHVSCDTTIANLWSCPVKLSASNELAS
jgi:hypothetical protein